MADPQRLLIDRIATPIGELILIADTEGRLRAVDWTDYEARMHGLLTRHCGKSIALTPAKNPAGLSDRFRAYFSGVLTAIADLPTATDGTPFQLAVWAALRQIPCGETVSYGTLAERIGRARAVRAVGLANGSNPISIAVPCHRVIGSDGSLTGYGGGLPRKRWLLEPEQAHRGRIA